MLVAEVLAQSKYLGVRRTLRCYVQCFSQEHTIYELYKRERLILFVMYTYSASLLQYYKALLLIMAFVVIT